MRFLYWMKSKRAERTYKKHAELGEKIQFVPTALCTDLSGGKGNIKIGNNAKIMGRMVSSNGGKIEVGNNFYMGIDTLIGASNSIKIGDCVIISNDVRIYDNNNHPTDPKARERMSKEGFSNDNWAWKHAQSAPVVIEDNVWIGQYCTILKGVTIGKGSIVGTRAVVTKDVPPYTVVAGNPAKVVKKIEFSED